MATGLDWVILRPSVVVGRAGYGGSALFRGLASLPVLPRMDGAGPISVVQLDDVVETVIRMLQPDAPTRLALDLPGPEPMRFESVVAQYRAWLGWRPARVISLPSPIMAVAWRLGDLAGWLGWRAPIGSTGRREMVRGAEGDPGNWTQATGIVPRSLGLALAVEPASVQERWFARLFLLKPLIFAVFGLFWILTGIISIGPGYGIGVELMEKGGADRRRPSWPGAPAARGLGASAGRRSGS
ncbi:hypothetical protein GCM10010994_59510 [Chelatococcus reniformis]|uniref:NAD(P)-binding domain-containing protein n=1 Tax=Chelatococcus reniformis TaxID=1494448 RepID=A0A916UXW9_9HYPH|nr:hypothetical protein [Chelatococcus reniformis]GGC93818.1 hypothetical protein GCM10010994_59510 [Chelatococcus reniformis]